MTIFGFAIRDILLFLIFLTLFILLDYLSKQLHELKRISERINELDNLSKIRDVLESILDEVRLQNRD